MLKSRFWLPACLLLSLTACGGSSTGSNTDDAAVISTGSAFLDDRDLSGAVATYCNEFDAGSTDSSIAFGCFLARFMILPESSDVTALLTETGQASIDVTTDILEDVVDIESSGDFDGFDGFHYTEYAGLPFVDILSGDFGTPGKLARLVNLLVESGTTHDEFIALVVAMRDDLQELEDALDVVLDDGDFIFAIPAGLFSTDADISVTYTDARLMAGAIKLQIVSLNILEAYDLGVNPEAIVASDGTSFNEGVLLADLNGAAGMVNGVTVDGTVFLTLLDADLVTGSEALCLEALGQIYTGLTALNDGEVSEFLENSFSDDGLATALDAIEDTYGSLLNNTMTQQSVVESHTVRVNLKAFFIDPPSATDVTDSDPFVETDDGLSPVESFFSALLTDIAEF